MTREQRADLAHRLLLTLHEEDSGIDSDEIDDAWREEIGTRVDDILNGKVQLISGEETQARFRAMLAERRK